MYYKKLGFLLSLVLFFFLCLPEVSANPAFDSHKKITSSFQVPFLKEYTFNIDGKEVKTFLFINESKRSMISAGELSRVFSCSVDWNDSSQIHITRGEKHWGFTNNVATYFTPTAVKIMDTAPIIIDSDFYIPLRYIAEELGYQITYCPDHRIFYLNTAADNNWELECEKTPTAPLTLTVTNKLPLWGSLSDTPAFSPLYGDEKLISGYYTTLIDRSPNRTNNIKIAAQAIDNMIILPGKVFSFNQAVGERTSQKGYREAPTFAGKKVVPGIGGGICQITSTLYNTALLGNFPVIERHPHSLKVAYVAPNLDASVAWPTVDFKFQNHYDFPVKLIVKVVDNYVVTGIIDARYPNPEPANRE